MKIIGELILTRGPFPGKIGGHISKKYSVLHRCRVVGVFLPTNDGPSKSGKVELRVISGRDDKLLTKR